MELKPVELIHVKMSIGQDIVPVGRLALHRGNILFEYDAGFVERGLNISPFYLPLQTGVQSGKPHVFDGLPGVFNDSLPDGWGRLLLDRAVMAKGIPYQQLTPLDRLAYVGSTGMGTLIYEPTYQALASGSSVLDLDELDEETKEVLDGEAHEVIDKLLQLGGSSAGARPKVLLTYNKSSDMLTQDKLQVGANEEPWMIKFASNTDLSEIGNIEYAYSLMAKKAGLDMPETRLFRGKTEKAYFGVKRFDREGAKRIHIHTASGLLNADHRIPSLDYENLFRGMLALNADVREVEKLFRLACFNVFAHNRDDHSKNFSFLMDNNGNWSFAPVYDLTFSYGPGGEHSAVVMGEGKHPNKSHLLKLAKKFQLKKGLEIVQEVADVISGWRTFAELAEVRTDSAKTINRKLESILRP